MSKTTSSGSWTDSHGSFVDRDMMMRFHWGFAPGHVYASEDARVNISEADMLRETTAIHGSTSDEIDHGTWY